MTKHEEKLELAKASAPRYGVYIAAIDSSTTEAVTDVALKVLDAKVDEKTKRATFDFLTRTLAPSKPTSLSNCNITFGATDD